MRHLHSKIFFDAQDYELLDIVNEVLSRNKSLEHLKKLFRPYLHPNGIKELSAPKELRIAYAVINLLDSLEIGKADDRIRALQSLRDEVLSTTQSTLRKNTARVLLSIMKDLVRSWENPRRQIELAHDFRMAAAGKPRFVRGLLRRYHLLEMPEEWNQLAADDHVHDANTKGRKSATHLIMDAWIKGIRSLTVIYYNYVSTQVATELLEAAAIMEISVRIGVEYSTRFRGRYVHLIWVPHGFPNPKDFRHFLEESPVAAFMNEGHKVSEYQRRYVMDVLQAFNHRHRNQLRSAYGVELAPLNPDEFHAFVGTGQASILHLAKFIHNRLLPAMRNRVAVLRKEYADASPETRLQIEQTIQEMDGLNSEAIVECYLRPFQNPDTPNPNIPRDEPSVPELLTYTPHQLLGRLNELHSIVRVTLNLSNLSLEDVLELLYDCRGLITHLEIFNLKDYSNGKTGQIPAISELQTAINRGNLITLKRIIRDIIGQLPASGEPGKRAEKLKHILHDIPTLVSYYRELPLKSRIGSDSTGRSSHLHGMGLVLKETLPRRVIKMLERTRNPSRQLIPVHLNAYQQITCIPRDYRSRLLNVAARAARRVPALNMVGHRLQRDWILQNDSIRMESEGNIATLGGMQKSNNELYLNPPKSRSEKGLSWRYLNSGLRNFLKILTGFVPAYATFALTKDWWLLTHFGAIIWFAITGFRNILQSVLGGGGIRRSPLLRWNSYISWDRIADSLLYTGFSVPLLDYLVKTCLLNRLLGINTETNPVALYSAIAIVNGLYISSHNAFRGLPRGAIVGNFFRSIISIPLAIAFNTAIDAILTSSGFPEVNSILQKWAAVISKGASDIVAGVIEGAADRNRNLHTRGGDYAAKLDQLFDAYARLELLFPEVEVFGNS